MHPFQFSCWNSNDPNRALLTQLATRDVRYQWLLGIVKQAFRDPVTPDPTNGSTHYKVTGTKAEWDAEVLAKNLVPNIIGRHSFFKIGPH